VIPTYLSMILMLAVFMVKFLVTDMLFRKHRGQFKRSFVKAAIFCVVLPLIFHKTCLCFYNNEIGVYSKQLGFGFNTELSRLV